MPANMDTLSGCSIQQLRHLASEHRVDIHGLTDKHELVNALQEAVPEALLLQEAAPSRPLAAPSRALAAPMGGGAGMPANMSLVPVQASQRVSDMDMQLLPRQATGGAATVRWKVATGRLPTPLRATTGTPSSAIPAT